MVLGVATPASLSLDGQLQAVFDSLSQASQQDAAPIRSPLINPLPMGLSSLGNPWNKLLPPNSLFHGVLGVERSETYSTEKNKKIM